jgi:hypothetical protein
LGGQIQKKEMSRTCGTHWRGKKYIQSFGHRA